MCLALRQFHLIHLSSHIVSPQGNKLTTSIHLVHDDNKDKEFELEMTWVCEASGWKHAAVPQELLVEAERKARAALEEGMEED